MHALPLFGRLLDQYVVGSFIMLRIQLRGLNEFPVKQVSLAPYIFRHLNHHLHEVINRGAYRIDEVIFFGSYLCRIEIRTVIAIQVFR